METSYTPVSWDFRETIAEQISKNAEGKVFYFGTDEFISSATGKITNLKEIDGKGLFIELVPQAEIRIDKIITLFGKPGPGYEEYDSYANACLACTGGYEL